MRKELIAYNDSKSPVSEMFRALRTNIQFMNSNKELKTLLVTSTFPGEGKSWVSANLAVTFAQAGKRVLLVDADMRKGRQFNIFNVSPTPGLSNCLSGIIDGKDAKDAKLYDFIQETGVENLYIMTAGNVPPNPSELLVSEKMLNLLKELKNCFDITIFDGTPSLLLADATILSRIVDSTVIVTSHNETKLDNVVKAKKTIQNVGGNVAGVVINKIPSSSKKYENSYYYYGSTDLVPSKSSKREEKHKHKSVHIEESYEEPDYEENQTYIEPEHEEKINTEPEYKYDNEYKTEEIKPNQEVEITIDKTQGILDQIQNYLNAEKDKLKNGDNND